MIHKWQVIDNLLGSRIVDALVATLYNQVSDFPETHQNYLSAIDKLKEELGEDNQHHVRKLVAAIDMKCSGQLSCPNSPGASRSSLSRTRICGGTRLDF